MIKISAGKQDQAISALAPRKADKLSAMKLFNNLAKYLAQLITTRNFNIVIEMDSIELEELLKQKAEGQII